MNPEQRRDNEPETYVQDPEEAERMARAEDPIREKISLAQQLGLSAEKIKELSEQADETAQEKARRYERATTIVDSLLTKLLESGGEVDFGDEITKANSEGYLGELREAIDDKIETINEESERVPKILSSGGKKWHILRVEGIGVGHKLKKIEQIS